MNLDSATTANAATLVGLNPSVGIIVLILGLAFLYLIKVIALNTDITKAIGTNHSEMLETVTAIRASQLLSDAKQATLDEQITELKQKITEMEHDLLALTRWQSEKQIQKG
jgi:F0F1-type ATP synthase membrane subunit b/b'